MRDHHTPTGSLGVEASLDGLSDGTNLVDLEQEGVASLLLDGLSNTSGVSDEEIVSDNLHLLANLLAEESVSSPIVLLEGILNGHDGVVLDELDVELGHLLLGLLLTTTLLEHEVVETVLSVELGGGAVHSNAALLGVSSLLNGLREDVETLNVALDAGGETTLITDVGGIETVSLLDDGLEAVVHLATNLHGLAEGLGTDGHEHELLEGQGVTGVLSSVDDVHGGDGEDELVLSGHLTEVLVQRLLLGGSSGLGAGQGGSEDGVGAELALVVGSVELEHAVINGVDVSDVHTDEVGSNNGLDVVDGLGHSLAVVGLASIAELDSLVNTSGSSAGNRGGEESVLGLDVDLDGGVTTRIDDSSGVDGRDGGSSTGEGLSGSLGHTREHGERK